MRLTLDDIERARARREQAAMARAANARRILGLALYEWFRTHDHDPGRHRPGTPENLVSARRTACGRF